VEAAEFIVSQLAPALPDVTFDIIGACLLNRPCPANVHLHGLVDADRKYQLLSMAHVAINPMTSGSGSNVKALDYMAHRLPVLSTAFGMRGIRAVPGEHFLQADQDGFADALRRALDCPEATQRVADAGAALVELQYNWSTIAACAAQRIDSLLADRGGARKVAAPVLVLNDYNSFEGKGGGSTRTQGLYETVAQWSPVVFVCFASDGALASTSASEGVTVLRVPKTQAHLVEQDRINALHPVSADDIVASRHSTNNPWLMAVYAVLRRSARAIVVEHCYLVDVPRAYGDRFVYSSQNNESQLKQTLLAGHPQFKELAEEVRRLEKAAVECSAVTVAVSVEDAQGLAVRKRTSGPLLVVRNGAAAPVPDHQLAPVLQALRARIGEQAVVFLGSGHLPNAEAARFIADQLAPQFPDVRFHLLGSACSTIGRVPRNVERWGVVDEVTKSAVMKGCLLALNPVVSGSGSNVKLADYLGHGLFVVTTEFGLRGYPSAVRQHTAVAQTGQFALALRHALGQPLLWADTARAARRALFEQTLCMRTMAGGFVRALQALEQPRKRVLYVTYRYTAPALGGAESNVERFVSALGHSGLFDVDVVAPEVSTLRNHMRFAEICSFDSTFSVPVDIPNVRFARFSAETPSPSAAQAHLRRIWAAQPGFERALDTSLRGQYKRNGLGWGWSDPEGSATKAARWTYNEATIFLLRPARVSLRGYADRPAVLACHAAQKVAAGPWSLQGAFEVSVDAPAGELHLVVSSPQPVDDPRPLGIRVSSVGVDGQPLDLSAPTLVQHGLTSLDAGAAFRLLHQAAQASRVPQDTRLTDVRGPFSAALERYIADNVAKYDLVVTHNNIFRPAVVALTEARKQGVPSILVPHAHLDDDFYHFPDWMQSARDASLVLAAPKAACDFLTEQGCTVRYMPAGCDADEAFTEEDVRAFRAAYVSHEPFVLVLGRKAGAKGYRHVMDAAEQLCRQGTPLRVVMIGPDDDGLAVDSPHTTYLGLQPRNVVRGALMSCVALCNMSHSESFGMVLLEAWRAGKPVIANRHCAAFHDMAVDGHNALLVEPAQLAEAIARLMTHPALGRTLAHNGRNKVTEFDWKAVQAAMVDVCLELASSA
jgi:glycosyltransferase involved in cell wall biosynthesis